MTTINQVRHNVIARKEKAEAERIARERATANSVEHLLDRANTNAGRALALASILAPINDILTMIAVADATNQDISLEQAGAMHKAFDMFDTTFASVFEAIDNGMLAEFGGDEDDGCDCCADARAAEAAYDNAIEVPDGSASVLESLIRLAAGRPH